MEQGVFYEVCGWVASIGMILGYLPQAVQTIRTRKTDDIALPTFLMMASGGVCFMLQDSQASPSSGSSVPHQFVAALVPLVLEENVR